MSSHNAETSSLPQGTRLLLKILLPLLVILLATFVTIVLIKNRPKPQRIDRPPVAPTIRTLEIERGDHRFSVSSQGTVQPRTQSALVAELSGRIIEVSPSLVAGGFFGKGQVLLRIDPLDYMQASAQAAAAVTQARLRLAREEAAAEVARKEWEELGEGPGSPLALHELQISEAKASLIAAQAAQKRAEHDLTRTEIRAPFAGRVRRKSVDLGQFVSRGTPVATIYSTDYAEIRLPIPDDQLAFLNLPLRYRGGSLSGGTPRVHLSASFGGSEYEWNGRIARTEGEIDPKTRMVYVVAEVRDPYGKARGSNRPPLSVGMFIDAKIEGVEVQDVATIPRSALRDGNQVLVVDEELRLHFRQVELLRLGRNEAIVKSGLNDGDTICLTPLDTVTENMLTQIRPEDRVDSGAPR